MIWEWVEMVSISSCVFNIGDCVCVIFYCRETATKDYIFVWIVLYCSMDCRVLIKINLLVCTHIISRSELFNAIHIQLILEFF